jgi:hypothetical protein
LPARHNSERENKSADEEKCLTGRWRASGWQEDNYELMTTGRGYLPTDDYRPRADGESAVGSGRAVWCARAGAGVCDD